MVAAGDGIGLGDEAGQALAHRIAVLVHVAGGALAAGARVAGVLGRPRGRRGQRGRRRVADDAAVGAAVEAAEAVTGAVGVGGAGRPALVVLAAGALVLRLARGVRALHDNTSRFKRVILIDDLIVVPW